MTYRSPYRRPAAVPALPPPLPLPPPGPAPKVASGAVKINAALTSTVINAFVFIGASFFSPKVRVGTHGPCRVPVIRE
jgi:hypothetical protein